MATNAETASWTKWVLGFLILGLVGLAGYTATALATEKYHDYDMAKAKASHDEVQEQRELRWDDRQEAIMSALNDLKGD